MKTKNPYAVAPWFTAFIPGTLLALSVTVGGARLAAAEDCACDRPEIAAEWTGLSRQVADLGFEQALLARDGDAEELFYENLVLRLKAQRRVPRHCLQRLLEKSGAAVGKTAVQMKISSQNLSLPEILERDVNDSESLYKLYRGISGYAYTGCDGQTGSKLRKCVRLASNAATRFRSEGLRSALSPELISARLSPVELNVLRAYDQSLEDSVSFETATQNLKTFEEKRLFLEIWGHQLSENYDFDRTAFFSEAASGVVTDDELRTTARRDARMPNDYLPTDIQKSAKKRAGICRDIHAFLGNMATKLGMKNVYLVQYATQSNQHFILTYQSGEKGEATKLYRQNYGVTTTTEGVQGGRALTHLGHDAATHYRIYDASGKLVSDVPSELGKFLSSSAGFSRAATDDPLLDRGGSNVVSVRKEISSSGKLRTALAVSAGRTEDQTSVVAGSLQLTHGLGTTTPTRFGVAVAGIAPTERASGEDLGSPAGGVLHLQVEQKVQTELIPVGKNGDLQLSATVGLNGGLSVFPAEPKNPEATIQWTGQASIKGGTEATLRLASDDGKYRTRTTLGQNLAAGQQEARDLKAWGFYSTGVYAQTTHSYEILPDLSAFADLTVVHSGISDRGRLQAGVTGERFVASASVSGRLQEDDALLEDGSLRRAGLDFGFAPSDGVSWQVGVEAPMEGAQKLLNTRVTSGLKVSF